MTPTPYLCVIGLGNPGRRYEGTRHNIGYLCADALAKRLGLKRAGKRFSSDIYAGNAFGNQVMILKPNTYMNLSGLAVRSLVRYHPASKVVVLSDDINLVLGKIRVRASGSAGGHHGLESIIAAIGTEEFPRIRIGIARDVMPRDIPKFVLSPFNRSEMRLVISAIDRVLDILEAFLKQGFIAPTSITPN